jgi:hypothetical protein
MRVLTKLLSATAVAAALSVAAAAPASAAIFINPWTFDPGGAITVTFGDTGIGGADSSLTFGADGNAAHHVTHVGTVYSFSDTFDFFLPSGFVASTVISTHTTAAISNLTFSSISFNGTAGTVGTFGGNPAASVGSLPVTLGGPQHLLITGSGGSNASYSGTATFIPIAVPEPATWGLMIMGFGGLGAMLRNNRRRAFALS